MRRRKAKRNERKWIDRILRENVKMKKDPFS